ncbi:Formimidoylglutamase [Chlamydiales bacterium SCGC AG-110-M15]|nr:Formimidoylglutamase [Chlamydiales bacterium SCGC AG-110-M15]
MESQKIKSCQPAKPDLWNGRAGEPESSRMHQIIECVDLDKLKPADFTILGFACNEGVQRNQGRVGAKNGPEVLRRALAKFPIHSDKAPLILDAGNIVCEGGDLEKAQEDLGKAVKKIRDSGSIPIVLGGGHEMAWGHYQGLRDLDLGIINFDAHFDLRPLSDDEKGSSGTPFLQIAEDCEKSGKEFDYLCLGIQKAGNSRALFLEADRLGVKYALADDFHSGHEELIRDLILGMIERRDWIYLTICLDVFAASIAPGVSAPQVMGLQAWDVMNIIHFLADTGKLASVDIAEMNPEYDRDGVTAQLGAHLLNQVIND